MRASNAIHPPSFPMATGGITRLAYAHAKMEGVDVDSLLPKSGLTYQQIDDPSARLNVKTQIKFWSSPPQSSMTHFSGFTSLRNSIFE